MLRAVFSTRLLSTPLLLGLLVLPLRAIGFFLRRWLLTVTWCCQLTPCEEGCIVRVCQGVRGGGYALHAHCKGTQ